MMNWFESRSLPVNDEIIQGVMNNPRVTCNDLEAIAASVANQDGMASPWINIILELEGAIVLRDYYAK